jgi:hypothetical protein
MHITEDARDKIPGPEKIPAPRTCLARKLLQLLAFTKRLARLPGVIESRPLLLFLPALSFFVASSLLRAYDKPLWHDELFTLTFARLSDPRIIFREVWRAAEPQSPISYLFFSWFVSLHPDEHLALRLPTIGASVGTFVVLGIFLSRHCSRLAALGGVMTLLCTRFVEYSTEARAYAAVLLCVALAMLAFQRIETSRLYAFLLAVSLAMSVALHYLAIFVLPAFVLAELTYSIIVGRLRVRVWLSICLALLVLVPLWPWIQRASQTYGSAYWVKATPLAFFPLFNELFGVSQNLGFILVAGLTVLLIYEHFLKHATWNEIPTTLGSGSATGARLAEVVLAVSLLWIPVIAVFIMVITGGGVHVRYLLPTLLGLGASVGYLLRRGRPAVSLAFVVLLLIGYGVRVNLDWRAAVRGSLGQGREAVKSYVAQVLEGCGSSERPVVVSYGYPEWWHYAPPSGRSRLVWLADPEGAIRYIGTDTVERNLMALAQLVPIRVTSYDEFRGAHQNFCLLSTGIRYDWWTRRFLEEGARLRLLGIYSGNLLFDVSTAR